MASSKIVPMSLFERARSSRSVLALTLLAIGLAIGGPVDAAVGTSGAEKLYRLTAMLLATGQRCRSTPDNFMAEYASFTEEHVATLKEADAEFGAELAARHGATGVNRVLGRLSRSMANNGGKGHPWLDCAQLKMATRNLIAVIGRETLEEAADQLTGDSRPSRFADAGL